MLKKYSIPIIMWLVFESIAIILWQTLDNIFYLFNFSYIGTSIAIGLFLFARKQQYARHVIQFAVGLYMLGYLGFLQHENMQIEGFWYYLFLGVFEAATIHYAVPDPECDLDVVPNAGRSADVRCVLSNSLGFGGHNASLLFQRWEGR